MNIPNGTRRGWRVLALALALVLALSDSSIARSVGLGSIVAKADGASLSVTGDAVFGGTLSVTVSGDDADNPEYGNPVYSWIRNGGSDGDADTEVGTLSSYVLQEADIGKTITIKVKKSAEDENPLAKTTGTVSKATGSVTAIGELGYEISAAAKTATITGLTENKKYDYKTDMAEYIEYDGSALEPGTYTFRESETSTHLAGTGTGTVIIPQIYTVTFGMNGHGTAIDAQYVTNDDGKKSTAPEAPTANGFSFKGWYTDNETFSQAFSFGEELTGDVTVYAKWVEDHTIIFDSNGGSDVASATVADGAKVTKPSDPTKKYYTFDGWYNDEELTTAFDFGNTEISENKTLYAKWTAKKYTITLNAGSYGALPANANSPITDVTDSGRASVAASINMVDPTNETTGNNHKVFAGWYTAADDGEKITADTLLGDGENENVTVYAQYTNEQVTVSFNLNGKTGTAPDPVTIDYNGTLEQSMPADPAVSHYTFGGWFEKEGNEFAGDAYTDETQITKSVILYAKWTPTTYTITLDATTNGGTNPASDTITLSVEDDLNDKLSTINEKAPATNPTGHDFDAWYTTASGEGHVITVDDLLQTTTFYARFTKSNYTVSFDLNYEATDEIEDVTVEYQETIAVLPSPGRDYYTFNGWYKTKNDGGELSGQFTAETQVESSMTVYAKWTPVDYNITYELGDGTNYEEAPATYNVESETITLGTPTKNGYDFAGWTLNDADGDSITEIIAGSNGNLTLFANWTATEYTISYSLGEGGSNDSANPLTYTIEDDAITLAAPTRRGYVFDEWTSDEEGNATVTGIEAESTGNKTFYAQWTPASLTGVVTVNNNDPDRDGVIEYGETLKATLSGDNNTGNLTYTWYHVGNDTQVASNTTGTYPLGVSDVDESIYCVITSDAQTGEGIRSAATTAVNKATLVMTGVTVTDKTYAPNDRVASINKGTITGWKNETDKSSISINASPIAGTFEDEYAGSGKAVTPDASFTLTSGNFTGYELDDSWKTGIKGNITAASQTISNKSINASQGGTILKSDLEALFTTEAKGALSFVDENGKSVIETIDGKEAYSVRGGSGGTEDIYVTVDGVDLNDDGECEYNQVALSEAKKITVHVNDRRILLAAAKKAGFADKDLGGVLVTLIRQGPGYHQRRTENGRLAFKTYADYEIHIQDTGQGISEEEISRIMAPFEGEKTAKELRERDRGLHIAKNVIELMGGELYVTSEPDRGTEFIVHLPLLLPSN